MSNVTKLRPKQALRLHCAKCGSQAEATCDCGVGYLSAGEFAAKAAAEHPEMSNRAIAEMTGVSEATLRRARGASFDAPETRTGLDGRQHPVERRQADQHHQGPVAARDRKVLKAFDQAMIVIEHICLVAAELEIPRLGPDKLKEAQTLANVAAKNIRELQKKLNRESSYASEGAA
jgi:hypothetical protein